MCVIMKKILYILSLFGLVSCNGYKSLSADEFQQMLADNPDAQLVDVRTPAEFAEGHLPGALNIDWRDKDFMQQVENQLDHQQPILVYCRSGKRSSEAAKALHKDHFKVFNLRRGFLAWSNAGKPVDRSRDVRYKLASGYFFRNDAVIDILPHSITSKDELLSFFGQAAHMGEGGLPTDIDFDQSMVIPIVLPPTDKETTIVVDSLIQTGERQLHLTFHVERGNESRTYTIIPCQLLIIDAGFRDYDFVISSPDKY